MGHRHPIYRTLGWRVSGRVAGGTGSILLDRPAGPPDVPSVELAGALRRSEQQGRTAWAVPLGALDRVVISSASGHFSPCWPDFEVHTVENELDPPARTLRVWGQ
jgi:hypothetical protein